MVKVFMPLYSVRAWGRFYGSFAGDAPIPPNVHNPEMCIYQRRKLVGGITVIKEKYYVPTNPRTPAQTSRRDLFRDAVSSWQVLDSAIKKDYHIYGAPFALPGYQKFLSLYLRGKV